MRGWAWGDVGQASAFWSRLLEGLPQAPEDIRVVLQRREVAGVDSQGLKRIGQHGFPCGLWHPPPRRLGAAVLRQPLAGPADQALEGGLCPGPLPQLPELRVGPAPPPLSLGEAVAYGRRSGHGWVVTEWDCRRDREHCERRRPCENQLEINYTDFVGPDCSIAALFRRALFLHDLDRLIDHHLVCTALLLCWFLV